MAAYQQEKEAVVPGPAQSQQELTHANNFTEDREIGGEAAHMVKVERVYRLVVVKYSLIALC